MIEPLVGRHRRADDEKGRDRQIDGERQREIELRETLRARQGSTAGTITDRRNHAGQHLCMDRMNTPNSPPPLTERDETHTRCSFTSTGGPDLMVW